MDNYLYDTSIPMISSLQSALGEQDQLMQIVSVVFDPKYAFLIYSPLVYLVSQQVGKKLIMTTILAEWLNLILKWLLRGERPYWYVHSSGRFEPSRTPIKQFPITCELGPGHPSGHSMLTAAVWYIIVSSLLEHKLADKKHTLQARLATWASYVVLLSTVGLSRVFVGCHFPHQCLAGALLGFLLARLVSSWELKPWHFISASLLMLTSTFGVFALLRAIEMDPAWTIRLAMKHCERRDWIHLDTAPFFSIMRYCGFALGTGLALQLPLSLQQINQPLVDQPKSKLDKTSGEKDKLLPRIEQAQQIVTSSDELKSRTQNNLSWLLAKLLMALLMARLVDNLGLFVSHANMSLFYSSAFLAYTGFSFAFINL